MVSPSYLNRMNSHWHHMMESLFNSQKWNQLDTEQLKRMTLEYPYFPIAQFMYAKKLKLDHHSAYPAQAAKTAVFFTNPYWLNWQMNMEQSLGEWTEKERREMNQPLEESVLETDEDENTPEGFGPIENVKYPESQVEEEAIPDNEIAVAPTVEGVIQPPGDRVPEKIVVEGDQFPTETLSPVEALSQDESKELSASESIEVRDLLTTETVGPAKDKIEEPSQVASSNGPILSPAGESSSPETAKAESLIPIEPLFTTDYFASQGIKLSEAEETNDRLGQKLKSFTEWLKSMKRIQPKASEVATNDVQDQKIQRIAETSNENREVLTETMAEVLLRQGLRDKAIEVYEKLSLLNPGKSAYFASKIEEIKVV